MTQHRGTFLSYTKGTSRGRYTYGYTIITLTDTDTGKRYQTKGGGYDMLGTVLAEWMGDKLQTDLHALLTSEGFTAGDYTHNGKIAHEQQKTYGCYRDKNGIAGMDGGVGYSAVEDVIKRLGYTVQSISRPVRGDKQGKFLGYYIAKEEV